MNLCPSNKVGETKVSAREDPLQAAAYEQALKRRPAPFVVQWRKEEGAKSKGKVGRCRLTPG